MGARIDHAGAFASAALGHGAARVRARRPALFARRNGAEARRDRSIGGPARRALIGRQVRSNAASLSRHIHARFTTVAWNAIAYVLPKVAVLTAGLSVAHRFGHEAFARYSLAAVTLMVVGNLVGASLGTVASKYVQEFAEGDSAL